MLKVSCKTGGKLVLASGLGITYDKDSFYDMFLKFEDGFNFTVRLKFGADKPDGKPELRANTDEELRLITIECDNFNDIVGTGTMKALNLGTYHGRKIYLNFWVRTPEGAKNREIRYCFYLEDADEGQKFGQ